MSVVLSNKTLGANYPPGCLRTLLTFGLALHFAMRTSSGCIIAFNVARTDTEKYLNNGVISVGHFVWDCWSTEAKLSCMAITFGAQGENACQSHWLQDKWEDLAVRHNVWIVGVPKCSESWSTALCLCTAGQTIQPGWSPTTGQVSHSTTASSQAGRPTACHWDWGL